jgi:hypothetical protein
VWILGGSLSVLLNTLLDFCVLDLKQTFSELGEVPKFLRWPLLML